MILAVKKLTGVELYPLIFPGKCRLACGIATNSQQHVVDSNHARSSRGLV